MRKITATEFLNMLGKNLSVFQHWDTPLEITDYVDCSDSQIKYLSKHLIFSGRNTAGDAADFTNCKQLEIATGTFQGFVGFSASGVKKIENLTVTTNKSEWSASFSYCKHLQIATGNYAKFVNFFESGIHLIHNLHIEKTNKEDSYTNCWNCPNLHTLEGWNLSKKIDIEPEKLEAEIKRRKSWKTFIETTNPEALPFL
jgi:hypothetical protein